MLWKCCDEDVYRDKFSVAISFKQRRFLGVWRGAALQDRLTVCRWALHVWVSRRLPWSLSVSAPMGRFKHVFHRTLEYHIVVQRSEFARTAPSEWNSKSYTSAQTLDTLPKPLLQCLGSFRRSARCRCPNRRRKLRRPGSWPSWDGDEAISGIKFGTSDSQSACHTEA